MGGMYNAYCMVRIKGKVSFYSAKVWTQSIGYILGAFLTDPCTLEREGISTSSGLMVVVWWWTVRRTDSRSQDRVLVSIFSPCRLSRTQYYNGDLLLARDHM